MYDTLERLRHELEPNEDLLWSGQPKSGIVFQSADVFLIPFSILWCGFAIFWEVGVLSSPAPTFFRLWGIPFVIVGLYLVFGRFITDACRRANTCYGVTPKRILILSGIVTRSVKTIQIQSLDEMELKEHRDGTGTISFGRSTSPMGFFADSSWPGMGHYLPPSFERIVDAREIRRLIEQAQSALRSKS
jgi:hypothetical protein